MVVIDQIIDIITDSILNKIHDAKIKKGLKLLIDKFQEEMLQKYGETELEYDDISRFLYINRIFQTIIQEYYDTSVSFKVKKNKIIEDYRKCQYNQSPQHINFLSDCLDSFYNQLIIFFKDNLKNQKELYDLLKHDIFDLSNKFDEKIDGYTNSIQHMIKTSSDRNFEIRNQDSIAKLESELEMHDTTFPNLNKANILYRLFNESNNLVKGREAAIEYFRYAKYIGDNYSSQYYEMAINILKQTILKFDSTYGDYKSIELKTIILLSFKEQVYDDIATIYLTIYKFKKERSFLEQSMSYNKLAMEVNKICEKDLGELQEVWGDNSLVFGYNPIYSQDEYFESKEIIQEINSKNISLYLRSATISEYFFRITNESEYFTEAENIYTSLISNQNLSNECSYLLHHNYARLLETNSNDLNILMKIKEEYNFAKEFLIKYSGPEKNNWQAELINNIGNINLLIAHKKVDDVEQQINYLNEAEKEYLKAIDFFNQIKNSEEDYINDIFREKTQILEVKIKKYKITSDDEIYHQIKDLLIELEKNRNIKNDSIGRMHVLICEARFLMDLVSKGDDNIKEEKFTELLSKIENAIAIIKDNIPDIKCFKMLQIVYGYLILEYNKYFSKSYWSDSMIINLNSAGNSLLDIEIDKLRDELEQI